MSRKSRLTAEQIADIDVDTVQTEANANAEVGKEEQPEKPKTGPTYAPKSYKFSLL
jgi:hypothetical protein